MAGVKVSFKLNAGLAAAVIKSDETQGLLDWMAAAALRMQEDLVPVDTGTLKNSLEIKTVGDGRQVGSFDVPYAAAVETGHKQGNTFVPAQPYIRPSVDAARKAVK